VRSGWPYSVCARKSVINVFSETGYGRNQTTFPYGSRIIGPSWLGPNCGATKISPFEADGE
jgi:hypothetical protein